MKPAVLFAAAVIGLIRPVLLFVEVNPHVQSSYEAAAHLLVGGLVGAWLHGRDTQRMSPFYVVRPWVMRTFWTLTAVEIACALITLARKFA